MEKVNIDPAEIVELTKRLIEIHRKWVIDEVSDAEDWKNEEAGIREQQLALKEFAAQRELPEGVRIGLGTAIRQFLVGGPTGDGDGPLVSRSRLRTRPGIFLSRRNSQISSAGCATGERSSWRMASKFIAGPCAAISGCAVATSAMTAPNGKCSPSAVRLGVVPSVRTRRFHLPAGTSAQHSGMPLPSTWSGFTPRCNGDDFLQTRAAREGAVHLASAQVSRLR
jgi:hypothetical protein